MEWAIRFIMLALICFSPQIWLVSLFKYLDDKQSALKQDKPPVVRLPDGIIAKFGPNATLDGAATQEYVYRHADPKIARVPRIYRYFHCQDLSEPAWLFGYLFMEYAPGKTLEELDADSYKVITKRLAGIASHLDGMQGGNVPGPVGGGVSRGNIWASMTPRWSLVLWKSSMPGSTNGFPHQ